MFGMGFLFHKLVVESFKNRNFAGILICFGACSALPWQMLFKSRLLKNHDFKPY